LLAELFKIEPGQKVSNLNRICRALVQKAMDGDIAACRLIFDRVDGPVQQKTKRDPGQKRQARPIPADFSGLSAAEAAKLYQEVLHDSSDWIDEDDSIH
jgi:hypothetical protein